MSDQGMIGRVPPIETIQTRHTVLTMANGWKHQIPLDEATVAEKMALGQSVTLPRKELTDIEINPALVVEVLEIDDFDD